LFADAQIEAIVFGESLTFGMAWFRKVESYRNTTPCRLRSNEVELIVVE